MGLENLLARLESLAVTSVTSREKQTLQLEGPSMLAVTPVTSVTSENAMTENEPANEPATSHMEPLPELPAPATDKDASTLTPARCRGCRQLETITLDGQPAMFGCVQQTPGGEYAETWRRIPDGMQACFGKQPSRPDQSEPRRQINCQAFEFNGVMMATTPESCRQWQSGYCSGCHLQIIQ